jgi:hypothetical protein
VEKHLIQPQHVPAPAICCVSFFFFVFGLSLLEHRGEVESAPLFPFPSRLFSHVVAHKSSCVCLCVCVSWRRLTPVLHLQIPCHHCKTERCKDEKREKKGRVGIVGFHQRRLCSFVCVSLLLLLLSKSARPSVNATECKEEVKQASTEATLPFSP